MAKPIRATPVLTGKYAISFVRKMKRRENLSKLGSCDRALLSIMHKNKKLFTQP